MRCTKQLSSALHWSSCCPQFMGENRGPQNGGMSSRTGSSRAQERLSIQVLIAPLTPLDEALLFCGPQSSLSISERLAGSISKGAFCSGVFS